jgi:hypothetical protein
MEQLKWGEVGCEIWEDVKNIPKDTYGRYLDGGGAVRLKEWGLTGDEPILMTPL